MSPGAPRTPCPVTRGGHYLVSRGTSLRVLTHRRAWGHNGERKRWCPRGRAGVPRSPCSVTPRGKGQGSDIAPAPLFAQPGTGFTAGAGAVPKPPAMAGHAAGGHKRGWPRQPDPRGSHMPGRWDVGSQEMGGRGNAAHKLFWGPSRVCTGCYQVGPETRTSRFLGFCP